MLPGRAWIGLFKANVHHPKTRASPTASSLPGFASEYGRRELRTLDKEFKEWKMSVADAAEQENRNPFSTSSKRGGGPQRGGGPRGGGRHRGDENRNLQGAASTTTSTTTATVDLESQDVPRCVQLHQSQFMRHQVSAFRIEYFDGVSYRELNIFSYGQQIFGKPWTAATRRLFAPVLKVEGGGGDNGEDVHFGSPTTGHLLPQEGGATGALRGDRDLRRFLSTNGSNSSSSGGSSSPTTSTAAEFAPQQQVDSHSTGLGTFFGLGGGSLHSRPGRTGTQWRLRAIDPSIRTWCVSELEYYTSATCQRSTRVRVDFTNHVPIASGYI